VCILIIGLFMNISAAVQEQVELMIGSVVY